MIDKLQINYIQLDDIQIAYRHMDIYIKKIDKEIEDGWLKDDKW